AHTFAQWFIPQLRVREFEKAIVNILAPIEKIRNETLGAIWALQEVAKATANVVTQNRMALDVPLASRGGVWTVVNTSCAYVDQSGRISTDLN
ncbi:ERVV2 protein, partial [Dromas ardeola]|nr:ERVV2 protein [Dromas ardeola]